MGETSAEYLPDSGMDTGSDAGEPGERNEALTGPAGGGSERDSEASSSEEAELAAAVADDAPLPPEPGVMPHDGGDQGDGLAPPFREPTA